jgi:hypothetical protein
LKFKAAKQDQVGRSGIMLTLDNVSSVVWLVCFKTNKQLSIEKLKVEVSILEFFFIKTSI